jgi:hypothetical protein
VTAEVIETFGPHSRMTPEQTLGYASARKWDKVIVFGYYESNDEFGVLGSHMSRETALWLVEHLKLHVLDRL